MGYKAQRHVLSASDSVASDDTPVLAYLLTGSDSPFCRKRYYIIDYLLILAIYLSSFIRLWIFANISLCLVRELDDGLSRLNWSQKLIDLSALINDRFHGDFFLRLSLSCDAGRIG